MRKKRVRAHGVANASKRADLCSSLATLKGKDSGAKAA